MYSREAARRAAAEESKVEVLADMEHTAKVLRWLAAQVDQQRTVVRQQWPVTAAAAAAPAAHSTSL